MSWGRGFTSEILNKFDVASKLLAYGSLLPGDSSNPVIQTQGKVKLGAFQGQYIVKLAGITQNLTD